MASDNPIIRTFSRLRRFAGLRNSNDFSKVREELVPVGRTGMFAEGELRHIGDIGQIGPGAAVRRGGTAEESVTQYLRDITTNTRKKIDEIRNMRMMAPEIDQAALIITASIMSPTDLQTDEIAIQVENDNLNMATVAKVSEYLTDYFNKTYKLGPKLYDWYKTAGFVEGAKAVLVLPKHQIDILNTVADQWAPSQIKDIADLKKVLAGQESLVASLHMSGDEEKKMANQLSAVVECSLEDMHIGRDFVSTETLKNKEFKEVKETKALADALVAGSFKLLKETEDGNGIIVTRDYSVLTKQKKKLDKALDEYEAIAQKQIHGFIPGEPNSRPPYPVLSLTDVMNTRPDDTPIVIEFPADSVIPVCAPGDNKNHLGYYVLLDEGGQPLRGDSAFISNPNADVVNRLATNAAKQTFGAAEYATFMAAGYNKQQALDQMTQIFICAVNRLIESKLSRDGLTGLDVHVHSAVGKALFFHLLAKNKIQMIFIPSPMMSYFRFDHRLDGTGKTLIEDIEFVIALRNTFTIAKIMAAVENATQHRRIEVSVDEKEPNPEQVLEYVRREYLAKKAPAWNVDPTTSAEGIISSHLSIVPKDMVGVTNNLEVTTEKSYGNAQAPDDSIMETLNNWTSLGLHVPPSALNQLAETEYSRSVATQNLLFANNVRGWQNCVAEDNAKFLKNYILCDHSLLQGITEIIKKDCMPTGSGKPADSNAAADAGDETANKEAADVKLKEEVGRTIASVKVVFAPAIVATNKAHFEEITAHIDAIARMVETVYPDDIAPSDELRSLMVSIRSVVVSNILREFLPKLGFHEIASLPLPEEIDSDMSARMIMLLNNFKRRFDNLEKLGKGELPPNAGGGDNTGGDTGDEGGDSGGEGGGEWG